MKYLAEVDIKSFRNLCPTRLVFRPGINIVLGRNAAGKTTLLNLLSRVVTGYDLERNTEPFEWTFTMKTEGAQLKRSSRMTVEEPRSLSLADLPAALTNADHFELLVGSKAFSAEVKDGRVSMAGDTESQQQDDQPLLAVLRRLMTRDRALATTLLGLAVSPSLRLDESLEYFARLLAFQVTTGDQAWRLLEPVPNGIGSLIEGALELDARGGIRRFPEFLKKAAKAMGYERAEALMDVESKTVGLTSGTTLRNLRFSFSLGKETIFHDSLSYGEKRLLAFFAAADASPDIVIVDELVNGLHHEWIKACLDEIGRRQAFLTSQNPLLLDYLEFSSAEEVARSFVLCERVRTERGTELSWRNPSAEEADDFFRAYESGIHRVSDILITKGLW